jgi:hypothetical protein
VSPAPSTRAAPAPESIDDWYRGTTSFTGTAITGRRGLSLLTRIVAPYTPGVSPVVSTVTVTACSCPTGSVPDDGDSESHGTSEYVGTGVSTSRAVLGPPHGFCETTQRLPASSTSTPAPVYASGSGSGTVWTTAHVSGLSP